MSTYYNNIYITLLLCQVIIFIVCLKKALFQKKAPLVHGNLIKEVFAKVKKMTF